MIKWMIHLRKQISVAAESLTPERKINSVERAGTDTTPEEQSQPDNSLQAAAAAAAATLTHTHTHRQQLRVMPWSSIRNNNKDM